MDSFGRYRIISEIGRGSMGTVYLAYDQHLERRVALKVTAFEPDDDEMIERFYREARVAAQIEHPNICPVYDLDETDGTHFITMAYIEGDPLTKLIDRDPDPTYPLPQRAAVEIICKLAQALEAMHQHGVIHRDLKPSNVILRHGHDPIITDFGLAWRYAADPRLTTTGAVLGSPAYLAPERVRNEEEIGPACDIYSLGVILYELLTGQLPFQSDAPAIYGDILYSEPPRPTTIRPEIHPRLEAICLRAMAKDADDRYLTMGHMAAATDPDNDPLTYTITAGNVGGVFTIDAATGQLTVFNGAQLNTEAIPQYTLTIQVTDGIMTDTARVTINVDNVNEAPEFNSPNNPDTYTFSVGYGSTENIWAGEALANDPDTGQTATLTYAITGGDPDGIFKINTGGMYPGWIQLAKDLPTNPAQYVLTITATDVGGLIDTATVTINVRTMVVIAGDLNGAETPSDAIHLEIIRLSSDLSQPLDVTYQVNWNNTARMDINANVLTNPLPAMQSRTITIPANQDRFVFDDIVPVADAPEGDETFTVVLQASANFVLPNGRVRLKNADAGWEGRFQAECTIRDGYCLFGNVNPAIPGPGDDDANEIDLNDIKQGQVGDCYFMAAIGAMALRTPNALRNLLHDNGDGTVTVTFHYSDGRTAAITVPIALDFGYQANLSGDQDANGNWEVWPIVLEAAYRTWIGWPDLNDGGNPATVWQHLTGQPASTLNTDDYTAASLRTRIEADWNADKMICVDTWGKDKKDNWDLPNNGGTVVGNHVYVVRVVTDAGIDLYNPWGDTHVTIPWDLVKDYVEGVHVQ